MSEKVDPLAPETLRESARLGIAITGKYLREVADKLDTLNKELSDALSLASFHRDHQIAAESRLRRAHAALKAVGDRLGEHYITPLEQTQLAYQCSKEWKSASSVEGQEPSNLARTAAAYLAHSDNGQYRDSAGLRPGASPHAEDSRAALGTAVERRDSLRKEVEPRVTTLDKMGIPGHDSNHECE
jgi:hypothetical protein